MGTDPLTNREGRGELPKPGESQRVSFSAQPLSSSPYSDPFGFNATNINGTALSYDDEESDGDMLGDMPRGGLGYDEPYDYYDGGAFSDRYSPVPNPPPPPPLPDTVFTPTIPNLKKITRAVNKKAPRRSPMLLPSKTASFHQEGHKSRWPHSCMIVRT